MTLERPRVVVIAGPTASGKSDLALDLAERFNGFIINADSQQRYRDFPILTAQPSADDITRAPHRLFGDMEANEVGTAAAWAAAAAAEIRASVESGYLPIVVGGTGLYLRALMEGFSDIPPVPGDVRAAARALVADAGNAEVHRRLAARDPVSAARIPVGNTQRLSRAWEVLEATGTPLSVWQEAPARPALDATYFSVLIAPARAATIAACAARFTKMIEAGALVEVQDAMTRGVARDAPAMNALGAKELRDHLEGGRPLTDAIAAAEIVTRQYAKRQANWFRHQFNSNAIVDERYTGVQRSVVESGVAAFMKGLS